MLLPALLRDARRRRGLSVRAAAEQCSVPRSTWAGWESGRTAPTAERLDQALAAVGFDLRLVHRRREPPGQERVRRHLRASLTSRVRTALGEQLDEVQAACRRSARVLTGPAAVGVWLPHVFARGPLPLPRAGDVLGLVRVRVDDGPQFRGATAFVPPPAALICDGLAERWPALLTAARLLHEQAPRDSVDRRLPAHRDPDEEREWADLSQTLTWGGLGRAVVTATDSRGWRLDAPATLDEALLQQGLPARHAGVTRGQRRRTS